MRARTGRYRGCVLSGRGSAPPAVAVSFAVSAHEGLCLVDGLASVLEHYAPWHLARADMLRRLGRSIEARECYARALPCVQNDHVRRFIERRLQETTNHREPCQTSAGQSTP
jgi:predicted RNA polymerase sigma factor